MRELRRLHSRCSGIDETEDGDGSDAVNEIRVCDQKKLVCKFRLKKSSAYQLENEKSSAGFYLLMFTLSPNEPHGNGFCPTGFSVR